MSLDGRWSGVLPLNFKRGQLTRVRNLAVQFQKYIFATQWKDNIAEKYVLLSPDGYARQGRRQAGTARCMRRRTEKVNRRGSKDIRMEGSIVCAHTLAMESYAR